MEPYSSKKEKEKEKKNGAFNGGIELIMGVEVGKYCMLGVPCSYFSFRPYVKASSCTITS
jgi:hypothetical protein